jgi:succinate dehydrogenase / fumarate reductase flavoprotein subunit
LLDLLVFGRRSGLAMKREFRQYEATPLSKEPLERISSQLGRLMKQGREKGDALRRRMQTVMMEYGSVFRNEAGLKKGIDEIRILKERYQEVGVSNSNKSFNYELMETIELGHQLDLAEAILVSALHRRESRGSHWREDFPKRDDDSYLKHTLIFHTQRGLEVRYKPVTITKFQPEARVY